MNENRYYVPIIDEFFVAFEFEEHINNIWEIRTLEEWDILSPNIGEACDSEITNIYMNIKDNKIRVKYLDLLDIEELGFTHLQKQSLKGLTERFEIKGLYKRICEDNDDTMWLNVYIEYSPDIHRIKITGDISCGSTNEKFFEGVIKNKSEFIKLLKQLNIK